MQPDSGSIVSDGKKPSEQDHATSQAPATSIGGRSSRRTSGAGEHGSGSKLFAENFPDPEALVKKIREEKRETEAAIAAAKVDMESVTQEVRVLNAPHGLHVVSNAPQGLHSSSNAPHGLQAGNEAPQGQQPVAGEQQVSSPRVGAHHRTASSGGRAFAAAAAGRLSLREGDSTRSR